MKINQKRFGEYAGIFGAEKMRFLWKEYLAQADKTWQEMSELDSDSLRRVFHNWRSSSQVFGMDEFARLCQRIEEKILKRRLSGLEEQIKECQELYEQDIKEVKAIFKEMDQ